MIEVTNDNTETKTEKTSESGKTSDNVGKESAIADTEGQKQWNRVSQPFRKSIMESATHELIDPSTLKTLKEQGLAEKFEIIEGRPESSKPEMEPDPPAEDSSVLIPGVGKKNIDTQTLLNAEDPLRTGDGKFKDNLVAYDGDRFFALSTDTSIYKSFVDRDGVVPFGGPVKVNPDGADATPKSSRYANITLGIDGIYNGGIADMDVLSVNISDRLKLDGKYVLADGAPHKGVFPIAPVPGSVQHWKWIEATIQTEGTSPHITIHRLSPHKDKPTNDADWDEVPTSSCRFPMRMKTDPVHANPTIFWKMFGRDVGEVPPPTPQDMLWHDSYGNIQVNEKVRD